MTPRWSTAISVACTTVALAAADVPRLPPPELPAAAVKVFDESLEEAAPHRTHVWRDTPPLAADGVVNAYVEIPRGERRKFEFDMGENARAVDRVIPETVGGYPVNYGFVPQTVSYDGDPFDALVIGAPQPGGQVVRGIIVGLMLMEDHKGLDSKVVLSPADAATGPAGAAALDEAERNRIAEFFNEYRRHEAGKFARVAGWGTPEEARAHIEMTHAFFKGCRGRGPGPCRVGR
jgi:inorganic pyrophosphatase